MSEIEDKDITFVIQGPVTEAINLSIKNIKNVLPQSQVVVSTVSEINVEIIGADQIVLSDDPGFFYYDKKNGSKVNNINRQIVSTLEGLKAVNTKYAFKLRSDFIFKSPDFLNYYKIYNQFDEEYRLFEERILACSYFSRNPKGSFRMPYHVSDLLFFGLKTDLLNLFDVRLMNENEAYYGLQGVNQYVPEQHLFIRCLEKNNKKVYCLHREDVTEANTIETFKYFANNFVFLNFEMFGVKNTKKTFDMEAHVDSFESCITPVEWVNLYKEFVDPNVLVPKCDEDRVKINNIYRYFVFKKRCINLIACFFPRRVWRRNVRNWLLEYKVKN